MVKHALKRVWGSEPHQMWEFSIWSLLKTTLHSLCFSNCCFFRAHQSQTSLGNGCIFVVCLCFRFHTSLLSSYSSLSSQFPAILTSRQWVSHAIQFCWCSFWPYNFLQYFKSHCSASWHTPLVAFLSGRQVEAHPTIDWEHALKN